MTRATIMLLRITLATAGGFGCLFVSDRALTPKSGSLVSEANAIIGRPLTPLSYAGVARRTAEPFMEPLRSVLWHRAVSKSRMPMAE
jgi:hypothetical protein